MIINIKLIDTTPVTALSAKTNICHSSNKHLGHMATMQSAVPTAAFAATWVHLVTCLISFEYIDVDIPSLRSYSDLTWFPLVLYSIRWLIKAESLCLLSMIGIIYSRSCSTVTLCLFNLSITYEGLSSPTRYNMPSHIPLVLQLRPTICWSSW